MHMQSALKSGYKYNFQFAGEKIGRKSPLEYRINSLYVHYWRWFIIFLVGPQLNTSLRSRKYTHSPYWWYVGRGTRIVNCELGSWSQRGDRWSFILWHQFGTLTRFDWEIYYSCGLFPPLWGILNECPGLALTDSRKYVRLNLLGSNGNHHRII